MKILNKKQILNDSIKNKSNLHPISDDELHLLQKELIKILFEINNVCKRYNIQLFLVGGSVLGAVRHKGFIPWDDDIDLGLKRIDYEKFKNIFEKELGAKYILRCPNSNNPSYNRFMQVYKKNTVLKTAINPIIGEPQCVYIDIFPYDYAPENILIRTIKGIGCNCLMGIASAVCDYKYPENIEILEKTFQGKILLVIQKIVGMCFSWSSPEKWFNRVDKAIQWHEKSKYITSATGRKHYLGEAFPQKVFFPLKKVEFEGHLFYVPSDTNTYLKRLYGNNYMEIPPREKRESHFINKIEV